MRVLLPLLALVLAASAHAGAPAAGFPLAPDSCRFAVIGDGGTGGEAQARIAARMVEARARFPFDLVLMLGDNLYGPETTVDIERKFTRPYRALLDAGVEFRAALGNHDDPNQRFFAPFHMEGRRYYTFRCPGGSVRFFVLDSTLMTPEQIDWLGDALADSTERWKVAYFHHPLYSNGTHGSALGLRRTLEPVFLALDVDVVFSGHEHFYERLKPQNGIAYFISGGAGKLRAHDIHEDALTAAGFDTGYHFMLVEIARETLFFRAISDTGATIDSGTIRRRGGLGTAPR